MVFSKILMIKKIARRFANLFSPAKSSNSGHPLSPLEPEFHRSLISDSTLHDLVERFGDSDPYPGFSKYLDAEHYLGTALHHYSVAGLHPSKLESVLDLGTGAGYFPFVCRNIGHETLALDVPAHPFYGEMISMLGVTRMEHRIEKRQPLPGFQRRFDLVTAFAICFNGHDTDDLWGPEEWEYFISDLRENVLQEQGRICLVLNRERSGETISPSLRELFESMDASLHDLLVKIPARKLF
jgi:hypothetical protein